MLAKEIGNRKISIYKNIDTYLGDAQIKWVLLCGNKLVKEKVEYLRNNFEYHSDEYKQFKKNNMSAWITGGTVIPYSTHKDSDIINPSNILCIDIDKCDNDIDVLTLKDKLFSYKFVYAVGTSVSGKGLFIIVPIKDYTKTKEYYNSIKTLLTNQLNIVCDEKCTNIARLRFISYDENIYIKNDDEEVVEWDYIMPEPNKFDEVISCDKPILKFNIDDNENTQRTFKAMEVVIDNGYFVNDYGAWYHLGCELKNHPDGQRLFYKASKNNNKFNDSDKIINNKWEQCKATGITEDLHRKWQGMLKNIK